MVQVNAKETNDKLVFHVKIKCSDSRIQQEIIESIGKEDYFESPRMVFINNTLEIASSSEVYNIIHNIEKRYKKSKNG